MVEGDLTENLGAIFFLELLDFFDLGREFVRKGIFEGLERKMMSIGAIGWLQLLTFVLAQRTPLKAACWAKALEEMVVERSKELPNRREEAMVR